MDKDEAKLLKAATTVRDLVDTGQHPNDAVEKVANDLGLQPGQIELVCYAINTGKQLGQIRNNSTVLRKFAAFDLAEPHIVIKRIYPTHTEKQKEAQSQLISSDYLFPPSFVGKRSCEQDKARLRKTATALVDTKPGPLPDNRDHNLLRLLTDQQLAKKSYDRACTDKRKADEVMYTHFENLVDYFRTPVAHRFSFPEVDQVAQSAFGKLASDLMGSALDYMKENKSKRFTSFREKRATVLTVIKHEIDLDDKPFSFIKGALNAVQNVIQAQKIAEQYKYRYLNLCDQLKMYITESFQHGLSTEKSGFFGSPALAGAVAGSLQQSMRNVPASQPNPVEDMVQKIDDPSHLNEMRKIKAHAMLNSLITDPDDPISSYDPEQVVNAFNEISQLVPRSSMQPFIMRPVLRRYLESNVQPFEAKELADIEKSLVSSRENKGLLKDVS